MYDEARTSIKNVCEETEGFTAIIMVQKWSVYSFADNTDGYTRKANKMNRASVYDIYR